MQGSTDQFLLNLKDLITNPNILDDIVIAKSKATNMHACIGPKTTLYMYNRCNPQTKRLTAKQRNFRRELSFYLNYHRKRRAIARTNLPSYQI